MFEGAAFSGHWCSDINVYPKQPGSCVGPQAQQCRQHAPGLGCPPGSLKLLMVQGTGTPDAGRKGLWDSRGEEPGCWGQGAERSGQISD